MSEIERDERLRAALRHAPDAALGAPHDLSAQILAAAHRAAAEPLPAPAPAKRPWWAFAAPRRLGAPGAFATVLMAGLVGVLWQGQQPPGAATDALNEVAAPLELPTPPAASAAPLQQAPPVVMAPEPPRKAVAAPATAAREPSLRQQERQRKAEAQADAQSKREAGQEMARLDERRSVQDLHKERPTPQRAREETAVAAAPPPPPPPAPVLAPAPAAEMAAPAAAVIADANPPRAAQRMPAATGGLLARPRPNAPWMDALAAGAQVQWSIDGEARPPTSSWLYALAEQTQGRWRAAPNPQLQAGDSIVQWQRGDTLLGRLWLGNERVLWCDMQQGRCEEAALPADVTSVLRKGLEKGLAR